MSINPLDVIFKPLTMRGFWLGHPEIGAKIGPAIVQAAAMIVSGARFAGSVEVKERKDRVDDAMHATRAAVEEGILPGGGVALLRATEALKRVRTQNDDQKTGVEIVRKALSWPARQIAINAGEDGSIIVGKILEKDQYAFGFDAQNGEYVNLVTKGIIDPTASSLVRSCKYVGNIGVKPTRTASKASPRWRMTWNFGFPRAPLADAASGSQPL